MMERDLEDEINPPLSSAVVTDPAAVIEEIKVEDEELAQMKLREIKPDLEKGTVVESVSIEEPQPKAALLDFPDGGITAWSMVFGAWWISFSTFGMQSLK